MKQYDRPPFPEVYVLTINNAVISVNSSWRMAYLAMMTRFEGQYTLEECSHNYTYDKFVWAYNESGEVETAIIEEAEFDNEWFVPDPTD